MKIISLIVPLLVASLVEVCASASEDNLRPIIQDQIGLMAPKTWNLLDRIDKNFHGVVVFGGNEGHASILVERLPGDPSLRLHDSEAEMVQINPHFIEEKMTKLADFNGEGVRKWAENKNSRTESILFYPKNRLDGWYIVVFILGKPEGALMKELDDVLRSLHEVNPRAKP